MKCPVCNNEIGDNYEFEICQECYFQYDPVQVEYPDYKGGANKHSLNEFIQKYNELKNIDRNFSCKNEKDRETMLLWEKSI